MSSSALERSVTNAKGVYIVAPFIIDNKQSESNRDCSFHSSIAIFAFRISIHFESQNLTQVPSSHFKMNKHGDQDQTASEEANWRSELSHKTALIRRTLQI